DEIVLVEDVSEPAQRVALRRERHDLVGEETQPADEEYRREDYGVAQASGAEQRDPADRSGIENGRARCGEPLRGCYRAARHQPTRRFLWKRPAFMMTDRFSPWPVNNSSFSIGSPSTTRMSAKAPGCTTPSLPGMRTISAPTSVACRMISIGDRTSRRNRNSRLWSTCSWPRRSLPYPTCTPARLQISSDLSPPSMTRSFFASISDVMPNSFARSLIA